MSAATDGNADSSLDGKDVVCRVGPRGELFSSQAAAVVFHAFLALDRTDQHAFADAVLRELTARQPRDTFSRKLAEAIRVLHEAARVLGEPPSIRRFEALRRQHPEWRWPAASNIRRWLGVGSWSEALRRASLPVMLPGDAFESELGPAFTSEEALDALRHCAHDLGRVASFSEYHAWAHRPDIRRRGDRRPLSEGPFCRLFGSFQNAITAAGLADDPRSASVTANGNVRAAHYRVSDQQILKGLQEVAARLSHTPNTSQYVYMRQTLYEQSRVRGRPRVLPSYPTIMRRFGRWGNALKAAGLIAADPADGS